MTLEELYLNEKGRIKRLALHYAKMFLTEPEDLAQVGALTVAEAYRRYAYKLESCELIKVTNKIINRKMYNYAKDEYKHKADLTH